MELTEAIYRRRMTRNFSGRPVDPAQLDSLLVDALRAPSAGHTQGRDLVVLTGSKQTDIFWTATTDASWRNRSPRFAGLSRAPVIVLPYGDPQAYVNRYREADKLPVDGRTVEWIVPYWLVDAAYVTMALLLRATSDGLGAAFLGNFRGEQALREALGVPERMQWLGAVLLGEPALPDPPSTSSTRERRSLDDVVHRGHW